MKFCYGSWLKPDEVGWERDMFCPLDLGLLQAGRSWRLCQLLIQTLTNPLWCCFQELKGRQQLLNQELTIYLKVNQLYARQNNIFFTTLHFSKYSGDPLKKKKRENWKKSWTEDRKQLCVPQSIPTWQQEWRESRVKAEWTQLSTISGELFANYDDRQKSSNSLFITFIQASLINVMNTVIYFMADDCTFAAEVCYLMAVSSLFFHHQHDRQCQELVWS